MKELLITDYWLVARATYAEVDTVIRFRSEMPTSKAQARYRTMLILKWFYKGKKDGMPKKQDLLAMSCFEDALETAIEAPVIGIQAACLTGGDRRSWRYYAADPKKFREVVAPVIHGSATAEVEIMEVDDPAWQGLTELMPLKECAHGGGA